MAKNEPKRGRNWGFLVYEDSLPEGEPMKTLDEFRVPYFLVWHDRDKNENGEPKKKHAHLLLMFDGNKSASQMKAFQDRWNAPKFIRVENLRSMTRYLTHKDNPEKAQYQPDEVICGYGADYETIVNLAKDRYDSIRQMMAFVNQNDIRYYSDLADWCALNNETWFRALCDNCREDIYRYIYSRASKIKEIGRLEAMNRGARFEKLTGAADGLLLDNDTGELVEEVKVPKL